MNNLKRKALLLTILTVVILTLILTIIAFIGSVSEFNDYEDNLEDFQEEDLTQEDLNTSLAEFEINQTQSINNVEYTLLRAHKSLGDEYDIPESGNIFLILSIDIKNNSSRDFDPYDPIFTLYADNKAVLDTFFGETYYRLNDILPGKSASANLSFSVPETAQNFTFTVQPNYSNKQKLIFDFNLD